MTTEKSSVSQSGCSICGFEAGPGWVGLRDNRGCSRAFCGYRGESLPDDHCRSCNGEGIKRIYASNGGVGEIETCVMCEGKGV